MVRARPSPAADHLCDRGAGEEGPSTTCAQPGRLPAFLPGEELASSAQVLAALPTSGSAIGCVQVRQRCQSDSVRLGQARGPALRKTGRLNISSIFNA